MSEMFVFIFMAFAMTKFNRKYLAIYGSNQPYAYHAYALLMSMQTYCLTPKRVENRDNTFGLELVHSGGMVIRLCIAT